MPQVGLAVYLHRRYGSKELVKCLHRLGFCASYHEANLFETSVLATPPPVIDDDAFVKYALDNADFNTRTLDGYKTFHCMGGILGILLRLLNIIKTLKFTSFTNI